jgi:hypothetical protein
VGCDDDFGENSATRRAIEVTEPAIRATRIDV